MCFMFKYNKQTQDEHKHIGSVTAEYKICNIANLKNIKTSFAVDL